MIDNEPKDVWGPGIPEYTQDDLMTYKDKLEFAMEIVFKYGIKPEGYKVIAAESDPDKIPNFVLEKDGERFFLLVKPTVYPDDTKDLPVPEKKHFAKHAWKFNAKPLFCYVGLGSIDGERFEAGLALKNDGYYANYTGMEEVKFKKSPEWIKQTLEEINDLDPARKKAEKVDESKIRYSRKTEKSDFEKWKDELKAPTFQEMLLTCIKNKGMKNVDFYKAAYMDRKLFSAIKNNKDYRPSKETAAACCFGLKLNLPDAQDLLRMAGYFLSLGIPWDRVVYYCLKKGIYDLDVVNELLYEEGLKCIGVLP